MIDPAVVKISGQIEASLRASLIEHPRPIVRSEIEELVAAVIDSTLGKPKDHIDIRVERIGTSDHFQVIISSKDIIGRGILAAMHGSGYPEAMFLTVNGEPL